MHMKYWFCHPNMCNQVTVSKAGKKIKLIEVHFILISDFMYINFVIKIKYNHVLQFIIRNNTIQLFF